MSAHTHFLCVLYDRYGEARTEMQRDRRGVYFVYVPVSPVNRFVLLLETGTHHQHRVEYTERGHGLQRARATHIMIDKYGFIQCQYGRDGGGGGGQAFYADGTGRGEAV